MVQFRRRKSFGGLRFQASQRGLGVSYGKGPARLSLGADGKVRRTLRIPGTGIYDRKVIGDVWRQRRETEPRPVPEAQEPELTTQRQAFDADGSPPATVWQRNLVRAKLAGKVAAKPDLSELTIGQAEAIVQAVGANPRALYRSGRMWGAKKQQKSWLKQRNAVV